MFVNFVFVRSMDSTGCRFDVDLRCDPILLTVLPHEPEYLELLTPVNEILRGQPGRRKTDFVMSSPPMDSWVQPMSATITTITLIFTDFLLKVPVCQI